MLVNTTPEIFQRLFLPHGMNQRSDFAHGTSYIFLLQSILVDSTLESVEPNASSEGTLSDEEGENETEETSGDNLDLERPLSRVSLRSQYAWSCCGEVHIKPGSRVVDKESHENG